MADHPHPVDGPLARSTVTPVPLSLSSRRTYAVWELTLACNLSCSHCGSRAGAARQDEMSTAEALDVVDQLAEVGIEEVTLIGGEAFLRPDWLQIAAAITRRGMRCTVTTGGYKLSAAMARGMREAGIEQSSISIDGMESTHDDLRGRRGSWQALPAYRRAPARRRRRGCLQHPGQPAHDRRATRALRSPR